MTSHTTPGAVTLASIKGRVSAHYELCLRVMTDGSRFRAHARPRQVAMYLARSLTPRSYYFIGRHFGNRDHTTVIHACRQIERLRATDPSIEAAIVEIEGELSGPSGGVGV